MTADADVVCKEYEYAGFRYTIYRDDAGLCAVPCAGQHRAANKDRHCRAAIEQYLTDRSVKREP